MSEGTASGRAAEAWGDALPDWVGALAKACDETSQAKAAKALGYTPATVSLVLRRKYPAHSTAALEDAVRGVFMAATVCCPVLGDIPLPRCLAEQREPFSSASRERVRLYRECHRPCPHNRKGA